MEDLTNENINNTEESIESKNIETTNQDNNLQTLKNIIIELEKLNAELKDKYLRKAAEFDNFKKKTENDNLNIIKYANEQLISSILPILDDFERFIQHTKEGNTDNPVYKGVELIYNKMKKILEQQGLKVIESLGKTFDVNVHDALLVIPAEDSVLPNTVVQEIEKGYSLYDKIIRHAKVIVSEDIQKETKKSETSISE